MAIMQVFKSSIASVKYIFKNGKEAHFINGKFLTDIEDEIKQLRDEITSGHPHIYVDAKETEIDTEADPLAALKEKLREQLLQEIAEKQAAALDPNNDMGNTGDAVKDKLTAMKLNVATTRSIASAAAGSASGATLMTVTPAASNSGN